MVPLVSPATIAANVDPFTEADFPPGPAVTVYPVIGLPPSDVGAVHVTMDWPLPGVALTAVGLPGMVAGVTGPDGFEAGPSPRIVIALTVNV